MKNDLVIEKDGVKYIMLDKVLDLIMTHDEGDGEYCDTGADMDWACRSHCVGHAVERIHRAINNER